ncbi:MAG: DUF4124 domain-containing protein [Methyloprofundus sp.]|nr:DUF4124 domain-containing protein [Methyloprofundus sp.]
MKITRLLLFILPLSPAYAEIYKCDDNGQTTYQQVQCQNTGEEFIPPKDISLEQQEAAVKKRNADLEADEAQKQQQREADDKERAIRAQEDNADASFDNARSNRAIAAETARQTEALENRNNSNPYYDSRHPISRP